MGFDRRPGMQGENRGTSGSTAAVPGKKTLTEQLTGPVAVSGSAREPAPAAGQPIREPQVHVESIFGSHLAVQRKAAPPSSDATHANVLAEMGGKFGTNFSDVTLHTDARANAKATTLGTEAVTEGKNIYFREGSFEPDTKHGQNVLGHELAHVIQQRDVAPGSASPQGFGVPLGERGSTYELEASRAGEAIVAGQPPKVELRTSGLIAQRFESNEHAQLGDETDKAIGGGGTAVSAAESARIKAEQSPTAGGGKFDAGQRSLTMDLRQRNPATGLPFVDSRSSTVALSYGEMLALSGDVYFSLENMKTAPTDEVTKLRDLVAEQRVNPSAKNFDMEFEAATSWRRSGIYKPGAGEKEGTKGEYWGDGGASYLDLAVQNNSHFSEAVGASPVANGPEGNAAADNHQAWFTDHSKAIALAKTVREAKKKAGYITSGAPAPAADPSKTGKDAATKDKPSDNGAAKDTPKDTPKDATKPSAGGAPAVDFSAQENEAYLYNAAGDHYLTDAFSSGHLINKKALDPVTDRVLNNATFEKLIDDMTVFADKEHPMVPHFIVRKKVASGLAVFKTDANLRHNVGAKLVHDYLNESGANVKSKNGKYSWTTKGDAHMDAATKDIASRAVLASRNYIRALLNDSDADLAKVENADDAWDYTPNVDASKFASMCEPYLQAQLKQSAKLWALMQNAVKAQDDLEKEKKAETKTAEKAKDDKGGDWGQQPNGTRFTRRMITAEGPVTTK